MSLKRARHLPLPQEHLLLLAASRPAAEAHAALQQFHAEQRNRPTSPTLLSLLPAAFENLKDYEPAQKDIAPFRAAAQRAWLINQNLFQGGAIGLDMLAARNIDTALLKGSAIVAGGYRSAMARPMSDVDILVPLSRAEEAQRVFIEAGWDLRLIAGGSMNHVFQVIHGAAVQGPHGGGVDLHWHVFVDSLNEHDDDPLWAAAVPVQLQGRDTRSLHPSDLVLHVIAHGARFNEPRILAWVLDAHSIITKQGEAFDWERLLTQSRRIGQMLQVRSCLEYLSNELGTPVPAAVLARLRSERVPLLDRVSYDDQGREDSLTAMIRRDISSYLKRTRGRPLNERIRGTVWHLQASREIERPAQVPLEMAKRLVLRLRGLQPPGKSAQRPRTDS